jgi:hypothetical protein
LKAKLDAAEQKLMNEVTELADEIYWLGEKFPSQKSILSKYLKLLNSWTDAPFWLRDYPTMERESGRIRAEVGLLAAKWNKSKKTISCVKGNRVMKVTDVKPKCPSGYRVK